MKIDKYFPSRVENVCEKLIFNFCFLNVDISLIMLDTHLILYKGIKNIAVEGTVSQIFYEGPSSFLNKI